MSLAVKVKHPYIGRTKGVCGGSPIIKGTRTSIKSIVGYYKFGMSVEEIIEGLPHLTIAQVYDALSYYHDHQGEIEQEIKENRIEGVKKEYNLKIDKEGKLVSKKK